MQLDYVDVVFANRTDSNTPMEGKWFLIKPQGTVGGLEVQHEAYCNRRRWENTVGTSAFYWSHGLGLFGQAAVNSSDRHKHKFIWQSCLISCPLVLYFGLSVFLYFTSVSVELLSSTGSLSCACSQPSLLVRSRIIFLLRELLIYFWVGLSWYKPRCVLVLDFHFSKL